MATLQQNSGSNSALRKLAVVTTHPIQYYAPIFRLMSSRGNIQLKVFYTLGDQNTEKYDPGFGKKFTWDIPLLDGYDYEWVENAATEPGSHHPKGVINPYIVKQISGWSPDTILVYGWAYKGHLKAMRYFKNKIPVYFRGDSTLLNKPAGLKQFIKNIFLRWVYRHVDHAFYVGTNNKAYYRKYGLKESQLTFAPHAIDNDRFKTDRGEDAARLRSTLNIPVTAILILYAGKFEYVKNLELLVLAFRSLDVPDAHLLLTGNGPLEEMLKNLAAENSHIHFMDFQNQTTMPALYQSADIFCLPSRSETWGLSINEAMACGKAILSSDKVGCAADLVKDGLNGLTFRSDSLESLTQCLHQLTKDKNKLIKFGEQSRRIIADWNFLRIAEAIENKLLHETL